MSIPDSLIDKVRQSVDIIEVASQYLTLKKTGRNYKCLCPFHAEKTPSFIISSDKQIYHCFGCGEGGNAINLVMKMDNIGFFDAIEKLARKVGITLPPRGRYDPQQSEEFKKKGKLYKLNDYARDFYYEFLKKSDDARPARAYLNRRKIDTSVIDMFKLGYASVKREFFLQKALAKEFNHKLLNEAGLIVFSEKKNRYYDRFYGRIIFPISDIQGRTVGFGARVLDNTLPKYLNSPDSLIFHKGKNLFGIDTAKRNLTDDGIIILEGYTDVLMCNCNNIKNVVATLGTALTDDHIKLLKRYTDKVVFIYDADKAGESATLRGLERFVGSGIRVNIACLPIGEDPDSLICKEGANRFLQLVRDSLSVMEYRLQKCFEKHDAKTIEGKVRIVDDILPLIKRITNLVEQREYTKKIAQLLDISEESLILELQKLKKGELKKGVDNKHQSRDSLGLTIGRGYFNAQRELLQIVINYPEEISRLMKELHPTDFDDKYLCKIVEIIYAQYKRDKKIEPAEIMDKIKDPEANPIIAQIFFKSKQCDNPVKMIDSLVKRIRECHLMRKHKELEEEVRRSIDRGERIENKKIDEYRQLTRYLKGSGQKG